MRASEKLRNLVNDNYFAHSIDEVLLPLAEEFAELENKYIEVLNIMRDTMLIYADAADKAKERVKALKDE